MLIQKIQGGLGNQMFEYAFIKALALRNNSEFKLDISDYKTYFRPYELEIFNIEKKYAKEKEIPFYERRDYKNKYLKYINGTFLRPLFIKLNKNHFTERICIFEKSFLFKTTGYFEGYFQNEKYFKDLENEIRKDFVFLKPLSKKNYNLLTSLKGKNTVSIHVRRGDYLKFPEHHPTCSIDYYNNEIQHINKKVKKPIFLFFSDDCERLYKSFQSDNYIIIDWNIGEESWQDMALMSLCNHNIIANSSFSWRGAYLNNNKKKIVIAPKIRSNEKAFNWDIIPNNWIKL